MIGFKVLHVDDRMNIEMSQQVELVRRFRDSLRDGERSDVFRPKFVAPRTLQKWWRHTLSTKQNQLRFLGRRRPRLSFVLLSACFCRVISSSSKAKLCKTLSSSMKEAALSTSGHQSCGLNKECEGALRCRARTESSRWLNVLSYCRRICKLSSEKFNRSVDS